MLDAVYRTEHEDRAFNPSQQRGDVLQRNRKLRYAIRAE